MTNDDLTAILKRAASEAGGGYVWGDFQNKVRSQIDQVLDPNSYVAVLGLAEQDWFAWWNQPLPNIVVGSVSQLVIGGGGGQSMGPTDVTCLVFS